VAAPSASAKASARRMRIPVMKKVVSVDVNNMPIYLMVTWPYNRNRCCTLTTHSGGQGFSLSHKKERKMNPFVGLGVMHPSWVFYRALSGSWRLFVADHC
jgi:hypothetical protein